MKWIALFGIVVFGVVAMTALDKYDEASCRENPPLVAVGGSDYLPESQTLRENRSACDGFLPW